MRHNWNWAKRLLRRQRCKLKNRWKYFYGKQRYLQSVNRFRLDQLEPRVLLSGNALSGTINLSGITSQTLNGAVIQGIDTGDYAGRTVASAGDVNRDGYDDFLIGAPNVSQNGTHSGDAYLLYGSESGLPTQVTLSDIANAQVQGAIFRGLNAGDIMGTSLASAGDVNGDGFDDLLISSMHDTANGASAGTVYLIYGQQSGLTGIIDMDGIQNGDLAGAEFVGVAENDRAGTKVSSAGDVNHDGYDDFLIGTRGADQDTSFAGAVYLVYGKEAEFTGTQQLSDIAEGNLRGSAFYGLNQHDQVGTALAAAGDVNGDGYGDFLIGAHGVDTYTHQFGEGEAYLIYGQASDFADQQQLSDIHQGTLNGAVFRGAAKGELLGYDVASAGDVDGDGLTDLLLGTMAGDAGAVEDAGQAYLIYGQRMGMTGVFELADASTMSLDITVFAGQQDFEHAGISVSSAGDVNGDGHADLLLGAPYADSDTANDTGRTFLVYGQEGRFADLIDLADIAEDKLDGVIFAGTQLSGFSGDVVASAGDVNGDGLSDLLIGAYLNDANGNDSGEAFLIYGQSSAPASNSNAISGQVWLDENDDGIEDDTENVIAGVRVNLLDDQDRIVAHAYTDHNGQYQIQGMVAGDYHVQFVLPHGYDFTPHGVGDDATLDSDADDLSGLTSVLTIGQDDQIQNISAGLLLLSDPIPPQQHTGELDLADLADESLWGAVFNGISYPETLGLHVSNAGDINGDGYDDFLFGATRAPGDDVTEAGQSFLVYGQASGLSGSIDLSDIYSGSLIGAVFMGESQGDRSAGYVQAAGDVNNDGYDDILISATLSDANGLEESGRAYLVYGQASGLYGQINLADIAAGTLAGAFFNGIGSHDKASSTLATAGDVNGDGCADILIGTSDSTLDNPYTGQSYLVYGQTSGLVGEQDLADIASGDLAGVVIEGYAKSEKISGAVSSAGDVNGDGLDDILLAVRFADPDGSRVDAGQTYLIYGQSAQWSGTLDVTQITTGQVAGSIFNGVSAGDWSGGGARYAGDVDGDGYDDFLIAAAAADPNGPSSGQVYLIYGQAGGFDTTVELSDVINATQRGAVFNGMDDYHYTGSISSAGDVNADGYDDFLIGVSEDDANPFSSSMSGRTYLVYGQSELSGTHDLSEIENGELPGVVFNGIRTFDESGSSLATAGDVNGDGVDDLLIGAPWGASNKGQTYLIYGKGPQHIIYDNSVSGRAWLDENNNGIQDDDEQALAGITVELVGNDVTLSTVTDAQGQYAFSNLTPGEYYLDIDPPRFYQYASQNQGADDTLDSDINSWGESDDLTLSDTQHVTSLDIGLVDPVPTADAGDHYVVTPGQALELSAYHSAVSSLDRTLTYAWDLDGDGAFDDAQGVHPVLTWDQLIDMGLSEGQSTISLRVTDINGDTVTATATLQLNTAAVMQIIELADLLTGELDGFVFNGSTTGEQAGTMVSSAGDVNGDGYDDFLIRTFQGDQDSEHSDAIYLLYGQPDLFTGQMDISDMNIAFAGAMFTGIDPSDIAGASIASAGDVNGDGFDDLLFGVDTADDNGQNAGKAYLVYGKATGLTGNIDLGDILAGTLDGAVFQGAAADDYTGFSVDRAGDIDGDGYDDLLIGARQDVTEILDRGGFTYLVYGSQDDLVGEIQLSDIASRQLRGSKILGYFVDSNSSFRVSSAGDFNGDGRDDLMFSATQTTLANTGRVSILYGGYLPPVYAAYPFFDIQFYGRDFNGALGYSIDSAGDVNADGYDDLLFSAVYADGADRQSGKAYLIYGGSQYYGMIHNFESSYFDVHYAVFEGLYENDQAGYSMSAAGDVNGDGYADLLIGVPMADHHDQTDVGSTYLLLGQPVQFDGSYSAYDLLNGQLPGYIIQGIDANEHAGLSVANAGDVNGDGYADFLIGAPGADINGQQSAGRTYLVYGVEQYNPPHLSLGDYVWEDTNGNGIQDEAEPAIADVTVNLLDAQQNVIRSTVTDEQGAYAFYELADGDYAVEFVLPEGYVFTTANQGEDQTLDSDAQPSTGQTPMFSLSDDDTVLNLDAGMQRLVQITGTVYDTEHPDADIIVSIWPDTDWSVSQTIQPNSPFSIFLPRDIAPVWITAFADINHNGIADDDEPSTITQTAITDLNQDLDEITLIIGQPALSSLSGTAFDDQNANGIREAGEPVFEEMVVKLLDAQGHLLSTTTTDAFGQYHFDQLTTGQYLVEFVALEGYTVTLQDQTEDNSLDSDVDRTTGRTPVITLGVAETIDTIGAGFSESASITGNVYDDQNHDKLQNETESGLAGVTIYLDTNDDNSLDWIDANGNGQWDQGEGEQWTLTDADGNYQFADLLADVYHVRQVLPEGYGLVWPTSTGYTVSLGPGSTQSDITFADSDFGIIEGIVWEDIYLDGQFYDREGYWMDESGLADFTVNVLSLTDQIVASVQTDADGHYRFEQLDPGQYRIQVQMPSYMQGTMKDAYSNEALDSDIDPQTGLTDWFTLDAAQTIIGMNAGLYDPKPIANAGGTYLLQFGSDLVLDASHSSDVGDGELTYSWKLNNQTYDTESRIAPTLTWEVLVGYSGEANFFWKAGNHYYINLKVTDSQGNSSVDVAKVIVLDHLDQGVQSLDGYEANEFGGALITGDTENHLGSSVSEAGDINGDGYDDYLLSSTSGASDAGVTYLIYGQQQLWGSPITEETILSGQVAGAKFVGQASGDFAGSVVSNAGDVNGDGYDDLLIRSQNAEYQDADTGAIYLVYGQAEGLTGEIALEDVVNGDIDGAVFYGERYADYAGVALSSAGDVNGDGYDDFLIGAQGAHSSAGCTYLIYGNADLLGQYTLDQIAQGTLDGAQFIGIKAYDYSGGSVAGVGDVNGDGFDDILIGAKFAEDDIQTSGQSYLIYGNATDLSGVYALGQILTGELAGTIFNGANQTDTAGYRVSSAGDVNGDGLADILIGAYQADHNDLADTGATYLIYGQSDPFASAISLADVANGQLDGAVFYGISSADMTGIAISAAGDVNADGYDDFLIGGSSIGVDGLSPGGQAYLIYGSENGLHGELELADILTNDLTATIFQGTGENSFTGGDISAAGDVNADGNDDFLIDDNNLGGIVLVYGTPTAKVHGTVWEDRNKDGRQSENELGLADVTVELWRYGSVFFPYQTTTTDEHGYYSFDAMDGDTYQIKVVSSDNMSFVTQNVGQDDTIDSDVNMYTGIANASIGENRIEQNVDAGVYFTDYSGQIMLTSWLETSVNALLDALDSSIEGLEINLYDELGNAYHGFYKTTSSQPVVFDHLPAGEYQLEVVLPEGMQLVEMNVGDDESVDSDFDPTTLRTSLFHLDNGQVIDNMGLGVMLPADVSGRVWDDANNNGIEDDFEQGLVDVVINLYDNATDALLVTTSTSADGQYQFFDLDNEREYRLEAVLPDGRLFTWQNIGSNEDTDSDVDQETGEVRFNLTDGAMIDHLDIGMTTQYQSSDLQVDKWVDQNWDGIYNAGDTSLSGGTIILLNNQGDELQRFTQVSSQYPAVFTDLPPGDYRLMSEHNYAMQLVPVDVGDNDAIDSDFNPETAMTDVIHLEEGQSIDLQLGLMYIAGVFGQVWEDLNANGLQDENEPGIDGVTINIRYDYSSHQNLVRTVTSANGGFYELPHLHPNSYIIEVIAPQGYDFTTAGVGTDDQIDSDVSSVTGRTSIILVGPEIREDLDIGLIKFNGSLSGKVWDDANYDGLQGESEVGISDVLVELYDVASGSLIQTTTTSSEGLYQFNGLAEDIDYRIQAVLPDGYSFTLQDMGEDDSVDSDVDSQTGSIQVRLPNNQDHTFDMGLTTVIAEPWNTVVTGQSTSFVINQNWNIGYSLFRSDNIGQSFVALDDSIDSFGLRFNATESAEMEFSLYQGRGDDGKLLRTGTFQLNPEDLLANNGWVDLDMSDITFVAGQAYSVIFHTDDRVFYYYYAVSNDDSYVDGNMIVDGVEATNPKELQFRVAGAIADPNPGETHEFSITLDAQDFVASNSDGYVLRADLSGMASGEVHPGDIWTFTLNLSDPLWIMSDTVNNLAIAFGGQNIPIAVLRPAWDISVSTEGPLDFFAYNAGLYTEQVTGDIYGFWANMSVDQSDLFAGQYFDSLSVTFTIPQIASNGQPVTVDDGFFWKYVQIQTDGPTGSILIAPPNQAPTADAAGPYLITEGQSVTLDASATTDPDNDTLIYKWDLDHDGLFDDSTGVLPTLSWATLKALGLAAGQHEIAVEVTDPFGHTAIASTTLLMQELGSINGVVWQDRNNNQLRDDEDWLLENRTVELYDADKNLLAITHSDADGRYQFTGLIPENYYLKFIAQNRESQVINDIDGNAHDDKDSDAVWGKQGWTDLIIVGSGQDLQNIDAGFSPTGEFRMNVWADDNANGILDEGETVAHNVSFVLTKLDGSFETHWQTNTPENSGVGYPNLGVGGLPAGDYTLQIRADSMYSRQLTDMNQGQDDLVDSDFDPQTLTYYFTLEEGQSLDGIGVGILDDNIIRGNIWDDANANGRLDDNESLWAGVTVNLLNVYGTQVASTITDDNGRYQFLDLELTDYFVQVQLPDGNVFTGQQVMSPDDEPDTDPDTVQIMARRDEDGIVTLYLPDGPLRLDEGMTVLDQQIIYWDSVADNGLLINTSDAFDHVTLAGQDGEVWTIPAHFLDQNWLLDLDGDSEVDVVYSGTITVAGDDGGGISFDNGNSTDDNLFNSGSNGLLIDGGGSLIITNGDTLVISGTILGETPGSISLTGTNNYTSITTAAQQTYGNANQSIISDINPQTGLSNLITLSDGNEIQYVNIGLVNPPPTADAGDGYEVVAGDTLTLDASGATDQGNDQLTYAWDLDHDGEFDDAFGITPQVDWTTLYDLQCTNGVYIIGMQVTDIAGQTDESFTSLTVYQPDLLGEVTYADIVDHHFDTQLIRRVLIADYSHSTPSSAGDINGDGLEDWLIAVPSEQNSFSDIHLIYGTNGMSADTIELQDVIDGQYDSAIFMGATQTPNQYMAVAAADDVNADGHADLYLSLFNADGALIQTHLLHGQAASIGGYVWDDVDYDGYQDDSESAMSQITVHLLDESGNVLRSTLTDASGQYEFDGLWAGEYAVRYELPQWYRFTLQDNVIGVGLGSDVNEQAGQTQVIAIASARQHAMLDAGMVDPNHAPEASPNLVATEYQTAIDIDVLSNDFDADGDELVVSQLFSTTSKLGVTLSINSDNTIHYDPSGLFDTLEPGQKVRDIFRYQIIDAGGKTDTHIVFVDVTRPLIRENQDTGSQVSVTIRSSSPKILANTGAIAIASYVGISSQVKREALAWSSQQTRLSVVSQLGLSPLAQRSWLSGLLGEHENENDSFTWTLKAVEE
ncbi:MAG: hypothetical protein CMJ19_08070 [Phycisphaeraceae bacterium]|nr:hypothetical protein [Phycisphaeraceae bacterium]